MNGRKSGGPSELGPVEPEVKRRGLLLGHRRSPARGDPARRNPLTGGPVGPNQAPSRQWQGGEAMGISEGLSHSPAPAPSRAQERYTQALPARRSPLQQASPTGRRPLDRDGHSPDQDKVRTRQEGGPMDLPQGQGHPNGHPPRGSASRSQRSSRALPTEAPTTTWRHPGSPAARSMRPGRWR